MSHKNDKSAIDDIIVPVAVVALAVSAYVLYNEYSERKQIDDDISNRENARSKRRRRSKNTRSQSHKRGRDASFDQFE